MSDRCGFLELPHELLGHVFALLDHESVPAARLSCRTFLSAATVHVWRLLIRRILREHRHLEAPYICEAPVPMEKVTVDRAFKWYAKMRYASSLRFFSGIGSQDAHFDGKFQIPDFGTISDSVFASVDVAGRTALCNKTTAHPDDDDGDNDFYDEYRAELQLTHLGKNPLTRFGAITFEIEMRGSDGNDDYAQRAMHFIYLRHGAAGRACYYFAPDGVHRLRVDRKKVKFIPDPSVEHPFIFNGEEESLQVRPDQRLQDLDRQWVPGDLPSPGPHDDLYLGVTLFAHDSMAFLRRVIVHA